MEKIFKALADKNRRKILTLLISHDLSVNEILKSLEIGQATLSNHLSILKKTKLVTCTISGKYRIYKIDKAVFRSFVDELEKFVKNDEIKIKTDEIIVRRKTD